MGCQLLRWRQQTVFLIWGKNRLARGPTTEFYWDLAFLKLSAPFLCAWGDSYYLGGPSFLRKPFWLLLPIQSLPYFEFPSMYLQ
jgi:hypothetical protein